MNIFYLDHDPLMAAKYHCDKHVVKMILESAQLVSTTHHLRPVGCHDVYKATHKEHPCTLGVVLGKGGFKWLKQLALVLCDEYTFRYGKVHASQAIFEPLPMPDIQFNIRTPVRQAMPVEFKRKCPVEAYRAYYHSKTSAQWPYSSPPK